MKGRLTGHQRALLADLREYVDEAGGGIDRHDAESLLDDPEARDATVLEFIQGTRHFHPDDYTALVEHLGTHGREMTEPHVFDPMAGDDVCLHLDLDTEDRCFKFENDPIHHTEGDTTDA